MRGDGGKNYNETMDFTTVRTMLHVASLSYTR